MSVETKRICNGTFGELWLDGDYGHHRRLKVGEGLCYILQYRQDTMSWWWYRREIRLVMPLR